MYQKVHLLLILQFIIVYLEFCVSENLCPSEPTITKKHTSFECRSRYPISIKFLNISKNDQEKLLENNGEFLKQIETTRIASNISDIDNFCFVIQIKINDYKHINGTTCYKINSKNNGEKEDIEYEEDSTSKTSLIFNNTKISCPNSSDMRQILCNNPIGCKILAENCFSNNTTLNYEKCDDLIDPRVNVKIFNKDSDDIKIIKCGNNFHIYNYFNGIKAGLPRPVFNWREEKYKKNLIKIDMKYDDYYSGQLIYFNCTASTIFSKGLLFATKLENGSIVYPKIDWELEETINKREVLLKSSIIITDVSTKELLCFAPVWNSNEWINTSRSIRIKESLPPEIIEVSYKTMEEDSSMIEVNCTVKGIPPPTVELWKDQNPLKIKNKNVPFHTIYTKYEMTKSVETTFYNITSDIHGRVYCNATNSRGINGTITKYIDIPNTNYNIIYKILPISLAVIVIFVGLTVFILKRHQRIPYMSMTQKEVELFMNGNNKECGKNKNIYERANDQPYNKEKYEIPKKDLDEKGKIGHGQFGEVIKAHLKRDGRTTVVAMKKARAQHTRELSKEIKILSFIGKHENIVDFIGAITNNMPDEAYIISEYCARGDLLKHLKKIRNNFLNQINERDFTGVMNGSANRIDSYVRIEYMTKIINLVQWAWEVANAMEYLAEKNVVHSDLAARNVLLTSDLKVKICDFGLSKKLYLLSIYTDQKNQLIPWAWGALEILVDHEFSTASDVWAFGVLVWELFSLGEVPYQDRQYNSEFIKDLKRNYRLPKPDYSNEEIYNIMRSCWIKDPKKRPTFTKLKHQFENLKLELLNNEKNNSGAIYPNVETYITVQGESEEENEEELERFELDTLEYLNPIPIVESESEDEKSESSREEHLNPRERIENGYIHPDKLDEYLV